MIPHRKKEVRDAAQRALLKNPSINNINNIFTEFLQNPLESSNFLLTNSTFYRDNFISLRGHLVHKIKAKDSWGRWAYYFVYVGAALEQEFIEAIESSSSMDLESYGKVIGSNLGDNPNFKVKSFLREKYNFNI